MSSNAQNSNRTSTQTSTSDNRVAADNGAIVVRDGSVQIVDAGAIEMAGDVSEMVIDLAYDVSSDAYGFSELALREGADLAFQSMQSSNDALAQIIERDRSEETQIANQLIRLGIPAAAFAVVAWIIWGRA